jgi:hypothetical protein
LKGVDALFSIATQPADELISLLAAVSTYLDARWLVYGGMVHGVYSWPIVGG